MKTRGFTLIELLVVITIIGILTIVTVAQFQTAQKRARDAQRKADISALAKALEMYYDDYGNFPKQLANAKLDDKTYTTSQSWCSSSPCPAFKDGSGYTYIANLPRDNSQNSTYPICYMVDDPVNPKKYALMVHLENGDDSDCKKTADGTKYLYSCGGVSNGYCYAITSPNTSLSTGSVLQ